MKLNIKPIFIYLSLLLVAFSFNSCDLLFPEKEPEQTANEYVYETFKEWYLWYDEMPEVDPDSFSTPEELIDTLSNTLDRWRYSMSATKLNNLLGKGTYEGLGAGFILDYDRKIRISHVYNQSPFGLAGVKRGWEVVSANGYTADNLDSVNSALNSDSEINFIFNDTENISHSISIKKADVKMNSVLYSDVIETGKTKVGYLVLEQFYQTTVEELKTVIEDFKNQNINELIVDLRYNGGGLNSVAYNFFSMIGGDTVVTKNIGTIINNDKHSDKNTTIISSYGGPVLNVPRIFFITTGMTASASEMVINCLKPYVECIQVGSNTEGKPVGMYIFTNQDLDLSVLPISFKYINSLGYGDYFNGLPADIVVNDDLTHGWGDPEEGMLKTALNLITNPALTYNLTPLKSAAYNNTKPLEYKGIYKFIQSF